ncbi:MAG: hypothetical protein RRY12_02090 [Cloacibacillus sp.]
MVAAIFIAATFIVFPRGASAQGDFTISGLPDWQKQLAAQSLTAVADGISQELSAKQTAEIIQTVAQRLFAGYEVRVAAGRQASFDVVFTAKEKTGWKTIVQMPTLQGEPLKWFTEDSMEFEEKVSSLLRNVPLKSISWSDRALQEQIEALTAEKLAGWKPAILIAAHGENADLTLSFLPEMPLILAVNPVLVSNSLPTLLHGEIREGLMGQFAPFIGVPVKWAARHSAEMKKWAEDYVNDQRVTERSSSYAEADFQASQISKLNVNVESRYYTIAAWAAVYAGTSDRSAELGIHVGRKVPITPNFDVEAYAEGILGLQEWNINGRFGVRWRSIRNLWLGGEWDTKDDKWWGRLTMDPQLHKPYVWLRVREDGMFNGALGWKATEYISFEVEYDERDEDRICLKLLGNL